MRILLVEASTDHQLALRGYLKSSSHDMDVVDNGQLAVEAFKSRRFDLVLIHMGIPVVNGYEVVAAMRSWEIHSGNAPIPIVALVDRGPGLGELAVSSGATTWLARPVTSKTFYDCLASLRWSSGQDEWTGQSADDKSKRIPIHVDPQLRPLIPAYLEKRAEDLAELKAFLKVNAFEKIRLTAHRLKGKGAGYGFPGISKVGDALEHAVSKRDVFSIREAIEEFERYLQRIDIVD